MNTFLKNGQTDSMQAYRKHNASQGTYASGGFIPNSRVHNPEGVTYRKDTSRMQAAFVGVVLLVILACVVMAYLGNTLPAVF